ncbi:MAG: lipopolysaccharide heptosyltransferase II [Verrucomicrobia bacterium]|nr:lipopolysaccharide heptosyltransferase II [Verrucomicrobiota bacterium]
MPPRLHTDAPAPAPQRILVRGVNWLGDAVMTTPALLRLRAAQPSAHITLLTPAKLADLWRGHSAVDAVMAIAPGESAWSVGRRLRAEKFEAALIFPNSIRAALEVWLGGVPERIGYKVSWRGWLLTQTVARRSKKNFMRKRSAEEIQRLVQSPEFPERTDVPATAHHIFHYLHLAAALGASPDPLPPQIAVSENEVGDCAARFGLGGGLLFGLNAGAEYGPAKRWPEERFVQAAVELRRRVNCRWVIFGGKGDWELAARITAEIQAAFPLETDVAAVNLAGRTSLRELCAALKACRVLLTNDTGPMHVAAAVGTPVVVPFGSTTPELTGPGRPGDPRHRLLVSAAPCAPCFLRACPIDFRCMKGIEVPRVVAAVLDAAGVADGGRLLPPPTL